MIEVEWIESRKIFVLSSIVYRAPHFFPECLRKYVGARQGKTFRPHRTVFSLRDESVLLQQEIEEKYSLRKELVEFSRMCSCVQEMLQDIAREELQEKALALLS